MDGFLEILSGGWSEVIEIQTGGGGGVNRKHYILGDHFQPNPTSTLDL